MRISDWSSDVCSSDLIHAEPSEEPLQYQINSITQGATCTTRQPNDSPPAQPTEAQEIAGIDRHSHPLHAPARLSNGRGDHIFAVGRRRCRHDQHKIRLRRVREQRSEEHTSELQSLMRISYAVFCLKKKKNIKHTQLQTTH